jgi:chromosome segregation ATPase
MLESELTENQKEVQNDRSLIEGIKGKMDCKAKELDLNMNYCVRQVRSYEKSISKISELKQQADLNKHNTYLVYDKLNAEIAEMSNNLQIHLDDLQKIAETNQLCIENFKKIDDIDRRLQNLEEDQLEKKMEGLGIGVYQNEGLNQNPFEVPNFY